MLPTPNDHRREAEFLEQMAQWISLQSDKQKLLRKAQLLRLRADMMETRIDCSPGSDQIGDLDANLPVPALACGAASARDSTRATIARPAVRQLGRRLL